jgi:hypothetical protein
MSTPADVDANSTSTSYCSTVRSGGVRSGGNSPPSVDHHDVRQPWRVSLVLLAEVQERLLNHAFG